MAAQTYTFNLESWVCYSGTSNSTTLAYTTKYTNSSYAPAVGRTASANCFASVFTFGTATDGSTTMADILTAYNVGNVTSITLTVKGSNRYSSSNSWRPYYGVKAIGGSGSTIAESHLAPSQSAPGSSCTQSFDVTDAGVNSTYSYCIGSSAANGGYNAIRLATSTYLTVVAELADENGGIYVGGLGYCVPYVGVNGVPVKASAYIGAGGVPVITKKGS